MRQFLLGSVPSDETNVTATSTVIQQRQRFPLAKVRSKLGMRQTLILKCLNIWWFYTFPKKVMKQNETTPK